MNRIQLTDRGVLGIFGEDARLFLQGLTTNDVRKVTPEQAVFSALLSPQGKFLYDFFIFDHPDGLLLDTDKTRLPELLKRLSMYRLRAKVELREMPELNVLAFGPEEFIKCTWCISLNPQHPGLGYRQLTQETGKEDFSAYETRRLTLGIPDGSRDLIFDRSILLEYGYDELHGVDFTKGCYVGQEVTARSKHRAQIRRFIHQVEGNSPLPPPGTPVMAGDKPIGEMRTSLGTIGLAHLHVQDAAKAPALESGGVTLTARLPDWCRTNFAEQ